MSGKYKPEGGIDLIKIGLMKHYAKKGFNPKLRSYHKGIDPSASASPSPSPSPSAAPEPEFKSGIYICKKTLKITPFAIENETMYRTCKKGKAYEIEKFNSSPYSIPMYKYRIKKIIAGDEPNETIRVVTGSIIEEHFRLFC
jgi:hypothetical protein